MTFLFREGVAAVCRDGWGYTKALSVSNTLDSSPEGRTKAETYADFVVVADYAKDAVSELISAGLVNGKNGCIAPVDYTTRAEVAVLIKRILDYTAKVEVEK